MTERQELTLRLRRLQAVEACRNVMGRMTFYETAFRTDELIGLWADRDDCVLRCREGAFVGKQAIGAYYRRRLGDRNNAADLPRIKGVLRIHERDTDVLEASEDARRVHGAWMSVGFDTYPLETGGAEGRWVWGKYCADFLLEDGGWRILSLTFRPDIDTDYHTPWTHETSPELPLWFGRE